MKQKANMDQFCSMDVLCIQSYSEYIIAGIGNSILIYEQWQLLKQMKIFGNERVHNIYVNGNQIIIKGIRQIAVLCIQKKEDELNCDIVFQIRRNDWIQDALILPESSSIAIGTAHNVIEIWNLETRQFAQSYSCNEKCILYSCQLVGRTLEDLVVFAGTVFCEIVIWSPLSNSEMEQPVLHRLKGHKGVIFSIQVDVERGIICTTSDDRSLRIWSATADNAKSSFLKRKEWENASISLILTLFGHTARVWKSLILPDYYISIGEDSKLCIWNKSGKLEKGIELHQDGGIRGLLYSDQSKMIITGGEDGGITALQLSKLLVNYKPNVLRLDDDKMNKPTRTAFLNDEIVSVTDKGCVFISDNKQPMKCIYKSSEFVSYCLLEISKCEKYIILGSLFGQIVMLERKSLSAVFDKKVIKSKILSLHWLSENFILTCGLNGEITLWEFNENHIELIKKKDFVLPESKERWSTCSLMNDNLLIIGDRMGSLFVYSLNDSNSFPIQSFIKIHGYLGVTDVIANNGCILSTGRDGTVKEYAVSNHLKCLLSHKLPFEWACKIVPFKNDQLVLGFSSMNFIIWSLKNREVLVKFNCGGGHRSYDYKIKDSELQFAYIKEKSVRFVEFRLDDSMWLKKGYHSKEINCFGVLQQNPLIFVSGSEDTTVRISNVNNNEINSFYVLRSHISSVRALTICPISETKKMIITAGGRAQIVLWDFNTETLKCAELTSLRLKNENRNWKNDEPSVDPETRFMCLDSVKLNDGKIVVAVGCSDCQIRMFVFDKDLKFLKSISYTHCILKIKFFKIGGIYLVISCGTDGRVAFWDVTNLINDFQAEVSTFEFLSVHQSGVNSLEIAIAENGNVVLATGGDDNLLSVLLLHCDLNGNKKMRILSDWKNTKAHSCQITGIKIVNSYLLTTSIDQRITVWTLKVDNENLSVTFNKQLVTPVPDIQGMEIYNSEEGLASVCVYGKGVESLKILDLQTET